MAHVRCRQLRQGAARPAHARRPWRGAAPLSQPDGGAETPVAFSETTASAIPERRADMVSTVTKAAAERGLKAYGSLSATTTSLAILNSEGVRRHARSSQASMVIVVRG